MVFESKQFLKGKIESLEEQLKVSKQETASARVAVDFERDFLRLKEEKLKAAEETNRKLYWKLKCYQAAEKATEEAIEKAIGKDLEEALKQASIGRVFADDFKEKYRKPKETTAQKLLGELRVAQFKKGTIPVVCGEQLNGHETEMLICFLENNPKAEFEHIDSFILGLKEGIDYRNARGEF